MTDGEFPADGQTLFSADGKKTIGVANTVQWTAIYTLNYNSQTFHDVLMLDNENYEVLFATQPVIGSGSSNALDEVNIGALLANQYDDFEDAAIDATLWTTSSSGVGTVTEAGGTLTMAITSVAGAGNAEATTDGSSGFDGNTADSTFIFRVNTIINNTITLKVFVTDNITDVEILNLAGGITARTFEFVFDTAANTVKSRSKSSKTDSWTAFTSTFNLAALSNYFIKFEADKAGGDGTNNGSIALEDTFFVQGAVTYTYQISANTVKTTAIAANLNVNYVLNGATAPTLEVSADGGSNFDTVLRDETVDFSNTGTSVLYKATGTTSSNRPVYVTEWGFMVLE